MCVVVQGAVQGLVCLIGGGQGIYALNLFNSFCLRQCLCLSACFVLLLVVAVLVLVVPVVFFACWLVVALLLLLYAIYLCGWCLLFSLTAVYTC